MGIDGSCIEESDSEGGGESMGDVRGEGRVERRGRPSLNNETRKKTKDGGGV